MHGADFTPVSHHSVMRGKFDSIGAWMEQQMGKRFFCIDAVLDTRMNQIALFDGAAADVQAASWPVADARTYVHWAERRYDVLVFGLPRAFQYGAGMGTHPLLVMQAISAQIIRHKRVLSDRVVIIAVSQCDGWFNDEEFPSYRETYELFTGRDRLGSLSEVAAELAVRPDYVEAYRERYAYHPFHGFSMTACADIAEQQAAAVYVVGAEQPGYARAMGLKTRGSVEEALADARAKFLPEQPAILASPEAFTRAGVHLCPARER